MGSETGAKWLLLILVYFTLMTVVVALVNDMSATAISTTGGYNLATNSTGTYCSQPRTIYEIEVVGSTYELVETLTSDETRNGPVYQGHIECELSRGQLGEPYCDEFDGCSWEPDGWWIFATAEVCKGQMNFTWLNTSDIVTPVIYDYIAYDLPGGSPYVNLGLDGKYNDICSYPAVVDNQTRCELLSCTWGANTRDIELFYADELELSGSMAGKMWKVVKQMVTFNFDFGFTNTTANFILNFLIFWLPLIGLGLALYQLIPFT